MRSTPPGIAGCSPSDRTSSRRCSRASASSPRHCATSHWCARSRSVPCSCSSPGSACARTRPGRTRSRKPGSDCAAGWGRPCGPRAPHEGPAEYAAAVAALRPDLGAAVQALAGHYLRLRYDGVTHGGRSAALRAAGQDAARAPGTRTRVSSQSPEHEQHEDREDADALTARDEGRRCPQAPARGSTRTCPAC